MACTLVLFWLGLFDLLTLSPMVANFLVVFYLALLIFSFSNQILHAKRVTANVLAATLCLYIVPGSFSGSLLTRYENIDQGMGAYF